MLKRMAAAVFAAALIFSFGSASAAQLGMAAPELEISEWVKGDAFKLADGKGSKIHVVEFWATWCGPCRTSIPHLTEMQKKFADKVVFVGISDETSGEVKPFVEKMGEQMDYRVALDLNRQTSAKYMEAFGVGGIPHAFVVDTAGNIAWHGHPMDGLDVVLEQILAGTYDMKAVQMAAEAEALLPEYAALITSTEEADKAKADAVGAKILEMSKANPDLLNRIAWALLTDQSIAYRNLEFAMAAAKTAYDATEGKDANVTDTYARAFYETGDLAKAIEYQEQAVATAEDPGMKAEFEKSLEKFKAESTAN